jgi:hypothetical protein
LPSCALFSGDGGPTCFAFRALFLGVHATPLSLRARLFPSEGRRAEGPLRRPLWDDKRPNTGAAAGFAGFAGSATRCGCGLSSFLRWRSADQGISPQFPGVLVGPPPTFASAIKCHQKSTSNSAGSSVGSLAPPRATPRLGGVYVSCQYFPCSFVLALRELGLRLGVKAPLSRSALAPVESSPGLVLLPVTALCNPQFAFRAICAKSRSRRVMHHAGVVLLWSSRDMHSGAARCTLGHVTHFTSSKSCAVGPLHPRISSSSAPCLFSCGEWIKAVSYVCIHMINLAHPRRSIAAR